MIRLFFGTPEAMAIFLATVSVRYKADWLIIAHLGLTSRSISLTFFCCKNGSIAS